MAGGVAVLVRPLLRAERLGLLSLGGVTPSHAAHAVLLLLRWPCLKKPRQLGRGVEVVQGGDGGQPRPHRILHPLAAGEAAGAAQQQHWAAALHRRSACWRYSSATPLLGSLAWQRTGCVRLAPRGARPLASPTSPHAGNALRACFLGIPENLGGGGVRGGVPVVQGGDGGQPRPPPALSRRLHGGGCVPFCAPALPPLPLASPPPLP